MCRCTPCAELLVVSRGREGKFCLPDCVNDSEGGKGKFVYPTALMIERKGSEPISVNDREGRRRTGGKGKLAYTTAPIIDREGRKILSTRLC